MFVLISMGNEGVFGYSVQKVMKDSYFDMYCRKRA